MGRACSGSLGEERGPSERYGRAKPETAWMRMRGARLQAGAPWIWKKESIEAGIGA